MALYSELEAEITQLKQKLETATTILRNILAADERGQGVMFSEAMDHAKVFVERGQ